MSSQAKPAPAIPSAADFVVTLRVAGPRGAIAAVEAYTAAIRQDEREKVADMLRYWDIVTREQSRAIKGEGLDD